jgi:hypothetical protein
VPKAAFYIDSHGFGHTTRSVELANAFPPDWEFVFKTNAPEWLFLENDIPRDRIFPSRLDIHPIHSVGYRVDREATYEEAYRKIQMAGELVDREIEWLAKESIDAVLTDISPLAVRAGTRAGLPAYGISNFTWDWIFEPMFEGLDDGSLLGAIREMMAEATLNFRLPFSEESTFPFGSVDTPLLYRKPRMNREEAREYLGFEEGSRYVLLTFGGFDHPTNSVRRLADYSPIRFVCVVRNQTAGKEEQTPTLSRDSKVENLWHLDAPGLFHPDLVIAVDGLITKPGYGILSESMSAARPLVLDSRHDFREFEAVYKTLNDYPQVAFVEHDEIASLNLEEPLKRVLQVQPEAWRGGTNGAEFIVRRISE